MAVTAALDRKTEVDEKLERVRDLLSRLHLDGVVFTGQTRVGWITAGLENPIIRGSDPALVWALVTRERAYLVTQNIEGPRVEAEESAAELGFEVATFQWYEDRYDGLVEELCAPTRLGNDGAGPGRDISDELTLLRLELTEGERERYRALGRDACAALEAAVRELRPGMGEHELAAEMVKRLELARIFPSVLLVGGDQRRRAWRHPSVSSAPIERDVLAVIVGVRGGLNLAASRTASLGPADPELAERHDIACEVEASMIAATRPGRPYGEVLQAASDAYERRGYPGEWKHHFQGGPAGYGPREFNPNHPSVANAWSAVPVAVHHSVAWNPTVSGAKSEDSFIVGADGPELVSNSDEWPAVEAATGDGGTLRRPAILELPA